MLHQQMEAPLAQLVQLQTVFVQLELWELVQHVPLLMDLFSHQHHLLLVPHVQATVRPVHLLQFAQNVMLHFIYLALVLAMLALQIVIHAIQMLSNVILLLLVTVLLDIMMPLANYQLLLEL
jgi:hypothetical protein